MKDGRSSYFIRLVYYGKIKFLKTSMNKTAFLIPFVLVLMLLVIYQGMTKQHLLKKTILENVQILGLDDSIVLNNYDKLDKTKNIRHNSSTTSGHISTTTTTVITTASSISNVTTDGSNQLFNDLHNDSERNVNTYNENGTEVEDTEKVDDDLHKDKDRNVNTYTENGTEVEDTEKVNDDLNKDKERNVKMYNKKGTEVIDRDKVNDNLHKGTRNNVNSNSEKRTEVKDTKKVKSAIDKSSSKISEKESLSKSSSINSICQKYILKYLDASLDETVLEKLFKKCFQKLGNNNEKEAMILNKQFLDKMISNVNCPKKQHRYLNESLPFVALASFPGSGNTWSRVLIEKLTGIYTGSVYRDGKAHFAGSKRCPTKAGVFIVKTHRVSEIIIRRGCPSTDSYSKAVFILRNPYEAILAEFNRFKRGKIGFAKEEAFKRKRWIQFVEHFSKRWKVLSLFWLKQFKKPVHVLVYENLKDNTILEMYRLMKFLHGDVTLRTLYCLVNKPQEQYYRAHKPNWMVISELFNANMIQDINSNIEFVRKNVDNSLDKIYKSYILSIKR